MNKEVDAEWRGGEKSGGVLFARSHPSDMQPCLISYAVIISCDTILI